MDRPASPPSRCLLTLLALLIFTPAASAQVFVRGRVDAGAETDISDALYLLKFLFLNGPAPGCMKAADVNDDSRLDISDPVYLLLSLFAGGRAIPPPHPDPGIDPTPDALSCESAPAGNHSHITVYTGPETCLGCHRQQAEEMHGSVHYQWSGPTPYVTNISGDAGKGGSGELGFNTYCGATVTTPGPTCRNCHVGYGGTISPEPTDEQLANIDCLVCHQEAYRRKPAGPFTTVPATGQDGSERNIEVPAVDASGFRYMPDEAAMGMSILEAAWTVHRPTRASCLGCHAHAGGSDGGKRGDLSSVTANAPLNSDVHLSPDGNGFTCQECHGAGAHRVRGRGLDLRPSDQPGRLECTACHPAKPHASSRLNDHTAHVACQTCHIPTYARDTSTEISRDWTTPVWSAGLFSGQGGWKPAEQRGRNLVPEYGWFDGTSEIYVLGQRIDPDGNGDHVLATPRGDVTGRESKIYPLKVHRGNAARHDATAQIIPHSTGAYFRTGRFDVAVETGMEYAGLSGSWTLVPVLNYQTINHGVAPHRFALDCGDCHEAHSGGSPTRMDLQGKLGYELKGPRQEVCRQCHGSENEGFQRVHDRHVRSKKRDCSWCHKFSRPELGLRLP